MGADGGSRSFYRNTQCALSTVSITLACEPSGGHAVPIAAIYVASYLVTSALAYSEARSFV